MRQYNSLPRRHGNARVEKSAGRQCVCHGWWGRLAEPSGRGSCRNGRLVEAAPPLPGPPSPRSCEIYTLANHHNGSSLQISALRRRCFCLKNRAILQKNGGPTEIILHFFSCFPGFSGFIALQAVDFQQQAAVPSLQKKSYQKHYRRFFVRPGICLNGVVKVGQSGRNQGCAGWTAAKRRPALCANRFGVRNDSSAFGHGRACTPCAPAPVCAPKPVGVSGVNQTQSNPIKNQSQSAFKVEETSRLFTVKEQRRDAPATFPVHHGVTLAPNAFGTANHRCRLRPIALNCT